MCWRDDKRTGLTIQRFGVRGGDEAPFALIVGHEADLVDAIAVIEPRHADAATVLGEYGFEPNLKEGIAL